MDFSNMAENVKEMISRGLPIMGAGMVGIFIVTGIIILWVFLLGLLGGGDGNFTRGLKALFGKNK